MTRWSYVTDGAPKPYVHPLVTPSGRTLTRVGGPYHPWHRGLWFTIKYVDGVNFWEEPEDGYGVQRVTGATRIDWVRPDGVVALREERTLVEADLAHDAWALDWTTTISGSANLDRTPYTTMGGYSGLTFKGDGEWTDTRLLLDDGSVHRRPEGIPSRWCDLSNDEAGLCFFDHPANPRHPVPWYGASRSRAYGDDWSNYVNAAFLFHEPMRLDGSLTFRYRIVVHDGRWDVEQCEDAWQAFVT